MEREQWNIYGLFVGINRYESEDIRPLAFASADVQAVRDKLAAKFGLDAERAATLADDLPGGRVPTRREILRAMNRFAGAPMGPADTFVLVFVGHGFVCSGKTFLAAADSEIGSEALLRETAVSLDSVRDFLAEIKAGQHVVILDACRDSPVRGTRSVAGTTASVDMTRDIGAVIRSQQGNQAGLTCAKAILCSCWEGQVAYEYPEGGHGWFCHNLLAELDTVAGPALSLADLHGCVKQRMKEAAWRLLPSAKDQIPHLLIDGDVPVLRLGVQHDTDGAKTTAFHEQEASPHPEREAQSLPPSQPTPLEQMLLDGRPGAALEVFKAVHDLSPRVQLLGCIAALAAGPMRRLHHAEANAIVGGLTELLNTSEQPLASFLLLAMSECYYRPLRRRMPSSSVQDIEPPRLESLPNPSRRLASVIPEVKQLLDQHTGGTHDS